MSEQPAELSSHAAASPTRLPPELLGRIFEHLIELCKQEWDQHRSPASTTHLLCETAIGPYTWTRVTHVCRYWRDVALCNPLLWTTIVLTSHSECVEAMISRSQQAPISVQSSSPCCHGQCAMPLRSLRLVLKEIHRIHDIDLSVKWWLFDDIQEALSKPAPMLHSFKLSTPSGSYDSGFVLPVVWDGYRGPPPPLEELTLCSYGFPWNNAAVFRGLKSLRVDRDVPRHRTVEEVLEALRFLPELRSLALKDIFYPCTGDTVALPAEPVPLPALEQIFLSGDVISCAALLHALTLPQSVRITFDYRYHRQPVHLASSLAVARKKFVRSTSSVPDGSPIRVLFEESRNSYTGCFWYSRNDGLSDDLADITVTIPRDTTHLRVLCRELRVEDAETVCLHDVGEEAEGEILSTMPRAPNCRCPMSCPASPVRSARSL